jgi:hypothetical protein
MVKKFALLFFCGFLSLSIQAQNFGGGLIAGISTSQVSGDQLGGFNKVGFLVGAFTNKSISQLLSLQMEITYIQKGSNNPKMNKNSISDISLSYIEIPLLLKYQQSNTIAIEGGIETAFLISSSDNDIYGKISATNTREFNTTDIGIFIGLDYSIRPRLTLNSRISNSILPIRAHASGATFQLNKGQYNSVLRFALNYIL